MAPVGDCRGLTIGLVSIDQWVVLGTVAAIIAAGFSALGVWGSQRSRPTFRLDVEPGDRGMTLILRNSSTVQVRLDRAFARWGDDWREDVNGMEIKQLADQSLDPAGLILPRLGDEERYWVGLDILLERCAGHMPLWVVVTGAAGHKAKAPFPSQARQAMDQERSRLDS